MRLPLTSARGTLTLLTVRERYFTRTESGRNPRRPDAEYLRRLDVGTMDANTH